MVAGNKSGAQAANNKPAAKAVTTPRNLRQKNPLETNVKKRPYIDFLAQNSKQIRVSSQESENYYYLEASANETEMIEKFCKDFLEKKTESIFTLDYSKKMKSHALKYERIDTFIIVKTSKDKEMLMLGPSDQKRYPFKRIKMNELVSQYIGHIEFKIKIQNLTDILESIKDNNLAGLFHFLKYKFITVKYAYPIKESEYMLLIIYLHFKDDEQWNECTKTLTQDNNKFETRVGPNRLIRLKGGKLYLYKKQFRWIMKDSKLFREYVKSTDENNQLNEIDSSDEENTEMEEADKS